jgi:5,6-dimethylbenzimidazole synthase
MPTPPASPQFDEEFRVALRQLVLWRRDVRRFSTAPVETELVHGLLELATYAPSVGLSQPWRFVLVESEPRRAAARRSFRRANAAALAAFEGRICTHA